MKKITIIDCFISSDKVLEKLETMISQFKNNGEDIFLLSNTTIPQHIQELTNYSFYDKHNRLFTDDYEDVSLLDIWKGFDKGGIHELEPAFQRHGLSVIINIFFILELCRNLGYTHFQRLEVDALLGEKSLEFMKQIPQTCLEQNKKGWFYVNKYDDGKDASCHYMFCEIDYFLNTSPKISCEKDYQDYIFNKWGTKKFTPVETFIFDTLNLETNTDVITRNGMDNMSSDFEDSYFNSETSEANLSPKYQGCSTRIYNCIKCENETDKIILTFNYKDKIIKRDVKIFYTDGSIDNIVHVVESKGYFTYTTHSKEIEKIEVYENDILLYDEYNKNIYSYVEFTIF